MTLPNITKKQQEIALLIPKFRFLDRVQIQKFLHHKNKKTINTWLPDLVTKLYLKRIYDPQSFREKNKPAIFHIDINGIRFLKSQGYPPSLLRKLYKEGLQNDNFINQCLFITDICLDLINQSYEFTTIHQYQDPNSPFHFLNDLKPQLVFIKINLRKYRLLDIFDDSLPRYRFFYAIKKKIRSYIEFSYSNLWEENISKTFPAIRFICPSTSTLIYAKRLTKKLLEEEQVENLDISFATIDDIKKYGVTADIWESPEI